MTTIPAPVTDTDLAAWLTDTIGPEIVNEYDAATALLTTFHLTAKTGTSLNNRQNIVTAIDESRTPNGPFNFGPIPTPTVAAALADRYRITRKPADYERIIIDLPMPKVVSRHQCPFCRRYTRASIAAVRDHMTRCWKNPALKTCTTCTHHQTASGTPGSSEEWLESCTNPAGPEWEDYLFPVLHCPLWEGTK